MTPEDWEVPLPIDGLEPPKEKKKRGPAPKVQQEAEAKKIAYQRLKVPNPPICNQCIDEVQAAGNAPRNALGRAAYTRTTGGRTQYLCFTHAQQHRDADGLAKFRAGDG